MRFRRNCLQAASSEENELGNMQISHIARAVANPDGNATLMVAGSPAFQLNPVASAIWANLTEGLSIDEVISRLAGEFSVSKQRLANDVNGFVELLKQNDLAKDSVMTPDFHAELVWNKGIAALCDWRIPDEFPGGVVYDSVLEPAGHRMPPNLLDNLILNPEEYRGIKDGGLVWVKFSWLKSFLKQVLPLIGSKFVLVTSDSDGGAPLPIMAEALQILEYSNVLHWFTQNCDGPGFMGRMSPIPIGIDFHTLGERSLWGEPIASPQAQERALLSLRRDFRPAKERIRKVYIDFAWQPASAYAPWKRYEIRRKLLTNEYVAFQRQFLPRREVWKKYGEYALVLSPHGAGLDCHRTWEALACGNVVLVPSSPLDSVYEGLPVIPIKDWKEVTPQNLNAWLDCYTGCEIGEERLRSKYWVEKMRAIARQKLNAAVSAVGAPKLAK